MRLLTLLLVVIAIASASAQAPQSADAAAPAFEVASVKVNTSGALVLISSPPGRFTATSATLRQLITNAYRLENYQLVGGPSWVDADRFDVLAKAPDGSSPEQIVLMQRTLLADRFKLAVHRETRELPIYALVIARSDGRLGPKMAKSNLDCVAVPADCIVEKKSAPGSGGMRLNTEVLRGQSLGGLVSMLASYLGRPVFDRTGLSGLFDYELQYAMQRRLTTSPAGDATATAPLDQGPTLADAVRDQLGLKLESTRGPVDMLIIDSVEKPTEN